MILLIAARFSCLLVLTLGAPPGQDVEEESVEKIPKWGGPAESVRPWGGQVVSTRPWDGNMIMSHSPITSFGWGGAGRNTRPWPLPPPRNFQPWGGAPAYTRPWRQPFMQPTGKIQESFPATTNDESGSSSTSNIEIMPAYPTQPSYQPYQPYQSPSQSYQPPQFQPYSSGMVQSPGWSRSYSPLPGNGNCFNTCKNRCGNYNSRPSCPSRPSCTSRCNIRPSCPSITGTDYRFSGNTLYCGARQINQGWSSQGVQGYNQVNQGYIQGNQGYNQGNGFGYAAGGCSSGGCNGGFGGYRSAVQATHPNGMARETVHPVTLPAPITFNDENTEDEEGSSQT